MALGDLANRIRRAITWRFHTPGINTPNIRTITVTSGNYFHCFFCEASLFFTASWHESRPISQHYRWLAIVNIMASSIQKGKVAFWWVYNTPGYLARPPSILSFNGSFIISTSHPAVTVPLRFLFGATTISSQSLAKHTIKLCSVVISSLNYTASKSPGRAACRLEKGYHFIDDGHNKTTARWVNARIALF